MPRGGLPQVMEAISRQMDDVLSLLRGEPGPSSLLNRDRKSTSYGFTPKELESSVGAGYHRKARDVLCKRGFTTLP